MNPNPMALALLATALPPAQDPPAARRPLPAAERAHQALADRLARADFERRGRAYWQREARQSRYLRTIPIDHPSLLAFPGIRFYHAELQLEPHYPAPPGEKPKVVFTRFVYQLVVLDAGARKVDVMYGLGPGSPLEPLLDAGRIAAPDTAAAANIQRARAVLWEVSRGASIFRKPGTAGMTRVELDRRFGLGTHAARHVPHPHRVVDSPKERILLRWTLRADDFDMPLGLEFHWLRFDRATGRWLGRGHARDRVFPADTDLEDPAVRARIAACVEKLGAR